MAQRTHYWSCTKFADWLRGTPKPVAATGEDWNDWHKTARGSHPVRYWLAEEGLDKVQGILWWPLDKLYDVKYYINNRWVTRTHSLTASPHLLPRGEWCDVGNRFLPCLFSSLVDFVEVELAWSNVAWDKKAREKYRAPFYSWGWFRWRTWRCPEAGIDYLKWAMTLTNEEWLPEDEKHLAEPTGQATSAREILELYTWWKEVYPNRGDPHDLSGWSAWCDLRRQKLKDEDEDARWAAMLGSEGETPEEQAETRRLLDLCQEIEQQQNEEDERMMIRLIKVRNHLWT